MKSLRPIEHVIDSQIAPVGTFTVRRALPDRSRHSVGPWVFLDHFGPFPVKAGGKDGVGAHPHAGIETVTYLLSGRNEHRDSAGHHGVVSAGGAQWMSAGRGIVHSERPLVESESELTQHGIQLWTTLPRALKMMPPRYQRIDAASIPTVEQGATTVRVIAGEYAGAKGPADTVMPLFLWHATIAAGGAFEALVPGSFEVAAYVIDGEASMGGAVARGAVKGQLVTWKDEEGTIRIANGGTARLEVLVLGGAPAEGPLVFHGPFVMNSAQQVRAAELAYRNGQMGVLEED
jgi:redox-sensitive bicupin YhaK (pirin superfamily)